MFTEQSIYYHLNVRPTVRATQAKSPWHPATLVDVVDGDTIKVKWDTQVTSVRMLNINTPERGRWG